MATVSPTTQVIGGDPFVTWTGIATGDTIESFAPGDKQGLAFGFQATGTFGGATVTLEASNDGTTWFELTDNNLSAISATSNAYFDGGSAARYFRPTITGGTSDDVDVVMSFRGS